MQRRILRLVPVLASVVLVACGGDGGQPGGGAAGTTGAAAPPGQRLYLNNCSACHQRNGEGVPRVQPALAGSAVTVGPPEGLIAWVMYGRRTAALPAGRYPAMMPQFAYLNDADLAALLTYTRTSFGNQAEPITPEQVAGVRAQGR